ncbi:MAG TPA: hypothetical protein VKD91_12470, partial [Pyrinomonadaceae bacterium]|nr:hypothetical protein [Pyrinomonadaceae bacterium]
MLKKKPSVELQASTTSIIYPCSPGGYSMSRSCPSTVDFQVGLTAITRDFNKQQVFVYTVTGGRVVGEGSKVTWDLSGSQPNVYTATVEVQDNKRHRALSSVVVKLLNCGDCVIPDPDLFCPTIVATCDNEVRAGTPVSCTVKLQPSLDPKATPPDRITYEWSARDSAGKDVSGRINGRGASISIRTDGLGGQLLATTVKVKGLDPACSETAVDSTA